MGLTGQISGLREQIQGLRGQISGLRRQISGLRGQISGLRGPEGERRMDKQKSICVLQEFIPFWAVAQEGVEDN